MYVGKILVRHAFAYAYAVIDNDKIHKLNDINKRKLLKCSEEIISIKDQKYTK